MPKRIHRATSLAAAAAIGTVVLGPRPAAATEPPTPASITCLGTEAITYTPGLQFTPRNVTLQADGTLGPCVPLPNVGNFSSGSITFQGSGSLSCSIGGNSSGTANIAWNNGRSSTFSFAGAVSLRPGGVTVLVLTGTVTQGAFKEKTVTNTITLLSTDLTACATPAGLTNTSGPITLTIT
ncbi:hypothetical protein ACFWGM_35000 [Streptomyces roseolus]|uniref:hypothetical protein n=1 Tax=Streptomyces roseolus TaxID=67358 RepID=UPI00362B6FC9